MLKVHEAPSSKCHVPNVSFFLLKCKGKLHIGENKTAVFSSSLKRNYNSFQKWKAVISNARAPAFSMLNLKIKKGHQKVAFDKTVVMLRAKILMYFTCQTFAHLNVLINHWPGRLVLAKQCCASDNLCLLSASMNSHPCPYGR